MFEKIDKDNIEIVFYSQLKEIVGSFDDYVYQNEYLLLIDAISDLAKEELVKVIQASIRNGIGFISNTGYKLIEKSDDDMIIRIWNKGADEKYRYNLADDKKANRGDYGMYMDNIRIVLENGIYKVYIQESYNTTTYREISIRDSLRDYIPYWVKSEKSKLNIDAQYNIILNDLAYNENLDYFSTKLSDINNIIDKGALKVKQGKTHEVISQLNDILYDKKKLRVYLKKHIFNQNIYRTEKDEKRNVQFFYPYSVGVSLIDFLNVIVDTKNTLTMLYYYSLENINNKISDNVFNNVYGNNINYPTLLDESPYEHLSLLLELAKVDINLLLHYNKSRDISVIYRNILLSIVNENIVSQLQYKDMVFHKFISAIGISNESWIMPEMYMQVGYHLYMTEAINPLALKNTIDRIVDNNYTIYNLINVFGIVYYLEHNSLPDSMTITNKDGLLIKHNLNELYKDDIKQILLDDNIEDYQITCDNVVVNIDTMKNLNYILNKEG